MSPFENHSDPSAAAASVPETETGSHDPAESFAEAPAEAPGEAPPGTVPPQPSMLDTSETMPPAEGIYAPEGDRPE